jgi:hypothetical protein
VTRDGEEDNQDPRQPVVEKSGDECVAIRRELIRTESMVVGVALGLMVLAAASAMLGIWSIGNRNIPGAMFGVAIVLGWLAARVRSLRPDGRIGLVVLLVAGSVGDIWWLVQRVRPRRTVSQAYRAVPAEYLGLLLLLMLTLFGLLLRRNVATVFSDEYRSVVVPRSADVRIMAGPATASLLLLLGITILTVLMRAVSL